MHEPNEKYVFDDMVARLSDGDPKFARRIQKLSHPRRRPRAIMAILLWTLAPFCIYYGGWTGFLLAVLAVGYGTHLMRKRRGFADASDGFSWWWSSRRSSLGG